jgi:hypothetical protein
MFTGTAAGMVPPSLSSAAVAKLPATRFGIGSAVNQAIRQIGGVLAVAATMTLVGHSSPQKADFRHVYVTHIALALITVPICLRVDTRPAHRPD